MLDTLNGNYLPTEISGEIDRARESLAGLPPAEREARSLMLAARLMSWARDLERMSTHICRAA